MPSFQDSAFIILLGLLLFGPKGLAKIARQLGKLVGEFRRASAEFRMQMEDELRIAEQDDQTRKIAAMQAAAPVAPLIGSSTPSEIPEPEHPHMPSEVIVPADVSPAVVEPLPIASSGDLHLMPPSTGLPLGRSASSTSLNGVFDAIPHHDQAPEPAPAAVRDEQEVPANG